MACGLVSIYCDSPQIGIQKNKVYKTLEYWSRNMLNFSFPEKGLELVSPPYFEYDFFRKMFPILYSIKWRNFIAWLPLLLEISGNMCLTIACWPGCGVIKFVSNLIFLIKPFSYMTKNSWEKIKYLENEKSFWGKIKSIFHHF